MVRLTDIDLPMIFKNRLLFSSGIRNNLNILPHEISKSLNLTNWSDQRNRSIFFAHSARDAQKWVGRINNPHITNGELYGDLEIHDADLALKLGPGRAPIGISAEIKWPSGFDNPTNFTYSGFAMVPNPEVVETMINFSKNNDSGFKVAKLYTSFIEDAANFSDTKDITITNTGETSDFEDHKHTYIINEMGNGETTGGYDISPNNRTINHTHKIVNYQVQVSEEHSHIIPKIFKSFEHKDEDPKEKSSEEELEHKESADFSDDIATSQSARGSPINEEEKENESNLMSAERRLNVKMEEKSEKNVTPKTEEEVEETTEETTTDKVEETKADFSKINDKIEALSTRVVTLEEKQAKFSEESEESEEKEKEVKEEAVVEETEEETKEDVVEEKETEEEKDSKADFSNLTSKIDKLANAIEKKEAAPMSTAEFGNKGIDKGTAVVDRLTNALSK